MTDMTDSLTEMEKILIDQAKRLEKAKGDDRREEAARALAMAATARTLVTVVAAKDRLLEGVWDEVDEQPRPAIAAQRPCLKCGKPFASDSVGNRICNSCQKTKQMNGGIVAEGHLLHV